MLTRRECLQKLAIAGASLPLLMGGAQAARAAAAGKPAPAALPTWYGFSLMGDYFSGKPPPGDIFREFDYATLAEWGFNFARLPISYWSFGDRKDWSVLREEALRPIDQAIAWGRQYKVHSSLCLHRVPGYCINESELEPHQLFSGPVAGQQKALAATVRIWEHLARRYRGIPNAVLSFDLINEPPRDSQRPGPLRQRVVEVTRALIDAIGAIDPARHIVIEGLHVGQAPIDELLDLPLTQSTRGYAPKIVSHYQAAWASADGFESDAPPAWPFVDRSGVRWDKDHLRQVLTGPYKEAMARKARIHVGEWGAFNKTPHAVTLAWMDDSLALYKELGWGWSLWNLRGSFGVLNSKRADVTYENFRGHKLDRKMLELLLAHR